jgi:hypothetical protein
VLECKEDYMLLTPSVLLKPNKRYNWGLCGDGMCDFMSAYPDGVEVTVENYRKLRRKFGYAIDSVIEKEEFGDATRYEDEKFLPEKFIEIFNKLIAGLDKPKRIAAKKSQ